MKVIAAPDSFKGSLSAVMAARAISEDICYKSYLSYQP